MKLKKIQLLLLMMIMFIGILAGCGASEDDAEKDNNSNEDAKTEQTEEANFPVTVTDGTGEELTIEEKPERIVSVLPSNTEIAFALGLGDQIVGVSDHDNYPEEAAEKEKIGGLELNVEKILALDPQLVLADQTNDEKALKQIEESGIPVLTVGEATDFEGVYETIELIGKATGAQEKADQVIGDMKDKLTALEEKANTIKEDERKKVYMEISPSPEIFTAGKNTFMDELLSVINADNAAVDQDGWVKMNEESVISMNPDVVITTYGSYVDDPVAEVTGREGWEDITAVKNEQIYDVNADLVNRPGPRLVEGAEELGKAIYPDVFKD
ncbi:ABC transporter substrate-binding protein [Lentibacillus sp. Marseille-P4043]|uniref:ABC transporter substrate-binding protein n=1 Tax=Lentibacillus sp. Marseille-P4043 TaxID=2040293 RepID=UPI000D0B7872|nr:ABC transporter substrate-binding protein [Lentibacillus sp. Marseille-P4043]